MIFVVVPFLFYSFEYLSFPSVLTDSLMVSKKMSFDWMIFIATAFPVIKNPIISSSNYGLTENNLNVIFPEILGPRKVH